MQTERLYYSSFGDRLGATLLDSLILLPYGLIVFWFYSQYRLFPLYSLVPEIAFAIFYNVYLVWRFGGTPGKLIMRICITKVDGSRVGRREAILRSLIDILFAFIISIAYIVAVLQISDADYKSLSFFENIIKIQELMPTWYEQVIILHNAWIWGELLVILTNRRRRAIHDFIAGTVVIKRTQ